MKWYQELCESNPMYKAFETGQKGSWFVLKGMSDMDDKTFVPIIPGLNNATNIKYLRAAVIQKHPEAFTNLIDKKILKAEKMTKSVQNRMKRKGGLIVKEIINSDGGTSSHKLTDVKSGVMVDVDGLEIDKDTAQGLLVGYVEYRQKYYQTNKKLKQAKETVIRAHKTTNKNDDDLIEQEYIDAAVQQAIQNNSLGSTIFINMREYFKLLLGQPCMNCKNKSIDNKIWEIYNVGFSIKTTIRCLMCDSIAEYSNEPLNPNFSLLVAGSSLVTGLNRQQNETFLASMGITNQICKRTFHNNQKKFFQTLTLEAGESVKDALMTCISHVKSLNQNILSVSFDTSWSHVQNANQASGEFIFQGNHPDYNYKPVIAYHVVEKTRMEHAILIAILNKITPILDQHDMLLDICVDGDLDSNKTLRGE
ncbi:4075_t:CDS:2 [Entrophospora sp. SA101]|nr:4075_t:CDS:2 [Entrophospora sp. SA101]